METSRTVVLYMKPECHLCEIARGWLEDFAADPDGYTLLALDEVDIRRDPAVFAEYRYRIPVIMVDGVIVAEGRMDATAQMAMAQALMKR
ncbi:MAG: glutaredoxin family protein [Ktedonobacterales bacterium]|nr:glutaredoxin family protein [Ktedonobacterales bacterium]